MRIKQMQLFAAAALALAGCASAEPAQNLAGDYLSGRFAAETNDVDGAAGAYAEASAKAPQQVDLVKGAFFYQLAAGDIDAAAGYARQILTSQTGDNDGLAHLTLAVQALKARRLKAARAELGGEMDAPFLKSISYLANVWIERDLNGDDAALAKLKNPGPDIFNGFNPLHIGFIAEEAGETEQAKAAYQAAALGMGGFVARIAYGAFLERQGDADAARDFYELLARDPGPSRRLAEEAERRLDKNKPSRAYTHVTAQQGAALAFYAYASAFTETTAGQRARAADAGFNVGEPRFNMPLVLARMALYLDPKLDEARRLVGGILNLYGDYEDGAAVLEQIPPSSPHFEQARIEIAGGLSARKEPEKAVEVLKKAIRSDPRGAELKLALANIYAGENEHQAAVDALDGVIASLPKEPDEDAWRYFVSRGASLLELGRWDDAEADLKRAVEIAPDEPMALNYLGYSWAERGLHLDEAFKLIEKAVEAAPHSGAIVDSLGWAHYQLGDYKQAVVHLEKAAALEPSDPTVTDHLGDVYWRLGRDIEARYQWERALELEPSEKLKGELQDKLDHGLADKKADKKGA